MGSFLLQELVRGLDERPLRRLTTGWSGFFDGMVDVAGVRGVAEAVIFTLSVPTAPTDINDWMLVDEIEHGTTDKVRLRQSDADLPITIMGILRTGSDPRWMPGPEAYHFHVQINRVTTALPTPLVLQLLDAAQPPTVLAEATGAPPVREGIDAILASSVVARPLLDQMQHATLDEPFDVVIDVNLQPGTVAGSCAHAVRDLITTVMSTGTPPTMPRRRPASVSTSSSSLTKSGRSESLVAPRQGQSRRDRLLHRIWPDFHVHPLLERSVIAVKADAARSSFGAAGGDVTWAVIDSGIDGRHPHFDRHQNLELH